MLKKVIFRIVGMHCSSCAMSIDWALEEAEGVKSVKTNYAKSQTQVEFDPDKISDKEIVSIISKIGYSAKPLKPL